MRIDRLVSFHLLETDKKVIVVKNRQGIRLVVAICRTKALAEIIGNALNGVLDGIFPPRILKKHCSQPRDTNPQNKENLDD